MIKIKDAKGKNSLHNFWRSKLESVDRCRKHLAIKRCVSPYQPQTECKAKGSFCESFIHLFNVTLYTLCKERIRTYCTNVQIGHIRKEAYENNFPTITVYSMTLDIPSRSVSKDRKEILLLKESQLLLQYRFLGTLTNTFLFSIHTYKNTHTYVDTSSIQITSTLPTHSFYTYITCDFEIILPVGPFEISKIYDLPFKQSCLQIYIGTAII